ncbi:MAG: hypothetical protein LKG31_00120 [Lactobacillus sp.]|jgi:hypothetical protein|nr:hypothetical protein [Lactobacillus sp.]
MNLAQAYIDDVTTETAKLIAKEERITLKQAKRKFIESPVNSYLHVNIDEFLSEGPDFFLDIYNNYKKYGRVASSESLYSEQHPELGIRLSHNH